MADPYIGEIRMFGGSFPPAGWATCDGQLISIANNDALFQLIGTTYGGDGQQSFGLPNLAARLPLDAGNGAGTYSLGQSSGTTTVTLNSTQLPVHSHPFMASTNAGGSASPQNMVIASSNSVSEYTEHPAVATMNQAALLPAGNSQPHDNMMPYLAVTFIIALEGVFPTQS